MKSLDRSRLRELFDLRSEHHLASGAGYQEDPYPAFHRLRDSGPIHEGTVHELLGWTGEAHFQGLPYPERPHYSAFSFVACDQAFRDQDTFASSPDFANGNDDDDLSGTLLMMGGTKHRRYRGLVQPSFVPSKAVWWIENWIRETVDLLIDEIGAAGQGDLNVDFCAAIPVLTITGSFGISIDQALDLRQNMGPGQVGAAETLQEILAPIVAARREQPQDDLISVLVHATFTDEDGSVHQLSDDEILAFSYLLLTAGSGTTWKQMGLTLAALLTHPDVLEAARQDSEVLKAAIEETLRWTPTDPTFARFVTRETEFFGQLLPRGAVLHLCLGAGNRDPDRWEEPDRFNPYRPMRPTLAFGNGPHLCLGMHVARAEMLTGIGALLDRLPNLRLDPEAESPKVIGMYERGPAEVRVLFG